MNCTYTYSSFASWSFGVPLAFHSVGAAPSASMSSIRRGPQCSVSHCNSITNAGADVEHLVCDARSIDMVNIFEQFLPQLLRYPNPSDPLNGEAANLLMREPKAYEEKVKRKSTTKFGNEN
jgi:hypothetical protein